MVTAKERKSWEKCKRFKTQKELALARLDAEIANHRAILTEQYAEMEFITKNCAEGALVTAKERDSWEEYKRLKAQKDPELARLDAEIAGHKATLAELYAEMESSMAGDDAKHQAFKPNHRGAPRRNLLKRRIAELRRKFPSAREICLALDGVLERGGKEYKPLDSWQKKAEGKRSWADLFDDRRTHSDVKTFINKVVPSRY